MATDERLFTKQAIDSGAISIKQARKEYNRMARIARKRIKRLETSLKKKGITDDPILNRYKNYFPQSVLVSDKDLRYLLPEVNQFLHTKEASLSGRREIERKFLKTAKERGIVNVTKENVQQFRSFMGQVADKLRAAGYDSQAAVKAFNSAGSDKMKAADVIGTALDKNADVNGIVKDFQFFMDNQQEFERTRKARDGSGSAEDFRRRINRNKRRRST